MPSLLRRVKLLEAIDHNGFDTGHIQFIYLLLTKILGLIISGLEYCTVKAIW